MTTLDPSPRVDLDLSTARQVGDYSVVPAPHAIDANTLRASRDGHVVDVRTSLVEMKVEGGLARVPHTRRLQAEQLLSFDDRRAILREQAILADGERWPIAIDVLDGGAILDVRVRNYGRVVAAIDVEVNGSPMAQWTPIGEEWVTWSIPLDLPLGTHRVELIARLVEGESRRGFALLVDWAEVRLPGPDHLVFAAADEGAPDHVEYRGIPSLVDPVHARLVPLLRDPRFRLRDDTSTDLRAGAPLDAALADRVLSRLEAQHDRRACWMLPAPSVLEVEATWSDGMTFRCATGRPTEPAEDPAGGRIVIEWVPDDGPTTTLLDAADVPARWTEQRFDRPSQGAATGRLRITTSVGDAALAGQPLAVAAPRLVPAEVTRERPNLLVYLIDTLRADRLSCYGNENDTTPTIDRLADDGWRFDRFHAIAAHTRPSTASALTGLHPRYHAASGIDRSLPLSVVTLAEMLRDDGFTNAAFVANNQVAGRGIHFEQGFHQFVTPLAFLPEQSMRPSSEAMNDLVLPWIDRHADEPFFLYLHSIDPHTPYEPPRDVRDRFDPEYDGVFAERQLSNLAINHILDTTGIEERDRLYLLNVYDAQIRHQDDEIARVLAALEQQDVLEETIVVFLSDHGEEFGEHGLYYHGGRMWQELIHVPLVVWVPERWRGALGSRAPLGTPGVVADAGHHLDFVPTMIDLLGLERPTTWQGDSLVPAMRGEPLPPGRIYLGEDREGIGAAVVGDDKLVWWDRRGKVEMQYGLFNLSDDPLERTNLASERPERVEELRAVVQARHDAFEAAGFSPIDDPHLVVLDDEATRQLEALGYLDPESTGEDPPNPPPPSDDGDADSDGDAEEDQGR